MRTSTLLLALVGLLLSGCGTESGAATARHTSGPARAYVVHGTGAFPPLDPADYPDARAIADGGGLTLDQVMRKLASQEMFASALADLRRAHREVYATGGLRGDGYFVVFTEAPPAEDLRELQDLPYDTVVYTGAPSTPRQLEVLMEWTIGELSEQLGENPPLESRVLSDSSGVEVRYNPGSRGDADLDQIEAATLDQLRGRFGRVVDLVEFVRDRDMRPFVAE